MKNLFFSLMLLFCGLFVQAQIVNIPDANFKNALINSRCVDTNFDHVGDTDADTNDDGQIQVSEAAAVSWLIVDHRNISDLTGIQAFSNLNYLKCNDNILTNLNLQGLINLNYVRCYSNQLTSLNV